MIDGIDVSKEEREAVHEAVQDAPEMEEALALVAVAVDELEGEDIEELLTDREFIEYTVRAGAGIMYEAALEHEYYLNAFHRFDPDNQMEWSSNQIESLDSVDGDAARAVTMLCITERQGMTAELAAYIALDEEVGLEEPEA